MKVTFIAHPNSKKSRVDKDLLGDLHVYVSEPTLEGKANKAIVKVIAEYFKMKKSEVRIVTGLKGKRKVVEIFTPIIFEK